MITKRLAEFEAAAALIRLLILENEGQKVENIEWPELLLIFGDKLILKVSVTYNNGYAFLTFDEVWCVEKIDNGLIGKKLLSISRWPREFTFEKVENAEEIEGKIRVTIKTTIFEREGRREFKRYEIFALN
jgi:hypothetical protein